MESTEEVYLRSSNRTRIIKSLQQVTHELFPLDEQGQFFVPHIRVRLVLIILPYRSAGLTAAIRSKRDENLHPDAPAPNYSTLLRSLRKVWCHGSRKDLPLSSVTTSTAVSMDPMLEPLDRKIPKYVSEKPIRIDGPLKASSTLRQ